MIELRDSRRLTGPNLFCAGPGAVLDVAASEGMSRPLVAAWSEHARELLDAIGWGGESLHSRLFSGGVSLVLTAPVDVLYAATEVNEAAFEWARADIVGETPPLRAAQIARLRDEIEQEANPDLVRLRQAAALHGVLFLMDPDRCSVGAGAGVRTFYVDDLPAPETLDWTEIHDVPLAMVTGTNGKSTTVRAVAAMVHAAGRTAGTSSTDGVQVGDDVLDLGDYSGPGGARRVLRDRYVDVAVLETARGGMLRRGLGVPRADVAAVLNVAEDHLGEFGMDTLEDLVETKLVVRRAVASGGGLVLGLDDPSLLAWREARDVEVDAFALDPGVAQRIADGEFGARGAWVEEGAFFVRQASEVSRLLAVDEAPMTLGGAATHNIANALAAILIALRLGLSDDEVRQGLLEFGREPSSNPGRTTLVELGGVRILADYAHNPHGLTALLETAGRLERGRVLLVLGQAGDRDDSAIRAMCRVAWSGRPDRILIKEMEHFRRGREAGEVPALIESELRRLGMESERIARSGLELDAVRDALLWARPGDLLLLPLHEHRDEVLSLLEQLRAANWQPGTPLP